MLYFSELENKKVVTTDGIVIGELDDLIFLLSGKPKLTKLVVHTKNGKLIISTESLQKFNKVVRIAKYFIQTELEENELYVKRNLLDKQIIDISGNKIVRANDVILQEQINLNSSAYECFVSGVDIGPLGILRRLHIENFVLKTLRLVGINIVSQFLSWGDIQPLDLMRGSITVRKEEAKLQNMRPEDLADHLEKTNEQNIKRFLNLLDNEFAVKVISSLNLNYQRDLFKTWKPQKSVAILEKMESDTAVDILLSLSKKRRMELVHIMHPTHKQAILNLLSLTKTPIGGRLSSEFFTASPTETVRAVTKRMKTETSEFVFLATIYVINQKKQLIGVFNPHELMLQEEDTPVYKFMTQNIVSAQLKTPLEVVVKKILKYRLPGIPVLDNNKQIIGIITFDGIADLIEAQFNK